MATSGATGDSSPKSVFISHSSKDAELAGHLCALLEAQNITCWLAPRDVVLGRPYADECVRGIEESASFLLLASEAAISSVQVISEVEQAHKRQKPIYTILIGKPKVTKELDYYISRLHWIEYGGDSVDTLANRLAKVLSGHQPWSDVAAPPSLRRTVLYRRDAFMGSAIATVLVLACVGAGVVYWGNRKWGQLDYDYRRLGYVALTAQSALGGDQPGTQMQAQVFLMAEGVPFRDVTLTTAAHRRDGTTEQSDHSTKFYPEQVGSVQALHFPLASGTDRISTCLGMPNPNLHEKYRVTQTFTVRPNTEFPGQVFISEAAQPSVSKEDGRPCGATP